MAEIIEQKKEQKITWKSLWEKYQRISLRNWTFFAIGNLMGWLSAISVINLFFGFF